MGGFLGAVYGVAVVLRARGAGTLTALIVAEQFVCSVVLDHFGWIGFGVYPASASRVAGCVLMVAGIVLLSLV